MLIEQCLLSDRHNIDKILYKDMTLVSHRRWILTDTVSYTLSRDLDHVTLLHHHVDPERPR